MIKKMSCMCGGNGIFRSTEYPAEQKGVFIFVCSKCDLETKPIEYYGFDMRASALTIAQARWVKLQKGIKHGTKI